MDIGQWPLLSRGGSIPIRMDQFSNRNREMIGKGRTSPHEQTGFARWDETLLNENGSRSRSGEKLVHDTKALSKIEQVIHGLFDQHRDQRSE